MNTKSSYPVGGRGAVGYSTDGFTIYASVHLFREGAKSESLRNLSNSQYCSETLGG